MAEQSHLEAMREAIKGDLERARARRPSIFERPAPPPVEIREPPSPSEPTGNDLPQDRSEPETVPEPVPAPEPGAGPEPVAEAPEPEPEPPPPPPQADAVVEAPEEKPGFLSRLAFWRR